MSSGVASYLSADFLTSNGIDVSKPLRNWLTRASYLAKNRGSEREQRRYVYWALRTIEEAVSAPGGAAAVDWKCLSPVMPPGSTEEPVPRLLQGVGVGAGAGGGGGGRRTGNGVDSRGAIPAGASPELGARSAVFAEAMRRASAELVPFVNQAFELYDRDVAQGKRHYYQVSSLEMINLAKNLHGRDLKQKLLSTPSPSPGQPFASKPYGAGSSHDDKGRAALQHQRAGGHVAPGLLDSRALAAAPQHGVNPLAAPAETPESRKRSRHQMDEPLAVTVNSPNRREKFWSSEAAFFSDLAAGQGIAAATEDSDSGVALRGRFVGTSSELERSYSRYEPSTEDIRPLPVLQKAFDFVRKESEAKIAREGRAAGLKYLNEQLKGMRQDLRVQNINSTFAVRVYEFHARLCLEIGDIGEFNQCQSALKRLYTHPEVEEKETCCMSEFFAYRVVYLSLCQQYDALSTELVNYTNKTHLSSSPGRPAVGFVEEDMVRRALRLAAACGEGDSAALMAEVQYFPVQMSYLVRIYLQRLRVGWLQDILFGVRGALSLRFLMVNLGFTPVRRLTQASPQQERDDNLFWLDGSSESAEREFNGLFNTLKVPLPGDFRFADEVARDTMRDHGGRSRNTAEGVPSLDSVATREIVEQYVAYLRTRKDAMGTAGEATS